MTDFQEPHFELSPDNEAILQELMEMDTLVNSNDELRARPGKKLGINTVKLVLDFKIG